MIKALGDLTFGPTRRPHGPNNGPPRSGRQWGTQSDSPPAVRPNLLLPTRCPTRSRAPHVDRNTRNIQTPRSYGSSSRSTRGSDRSIWAQPRESRPRVRAGRRHPILWHTCGAGCSTYDRKPLFGPKSGGGILSTNTRRIQWSWRDLNPWPPRCERCSQEPLTRGNRSNPRPCGAAVELAV